MEYQELLKLTTLEGKTPEEKVHAVGTLFDLSFDNNNIEGLKHGFNLAEQIKIQDLDEKLYTVLHYDLANGWGYLRKLKYHNTSNDWNFHNEETVQEILNFRKALASPGFSSVQVERQCQIYTNLGCTLSYIGRFVEAQEYWNKAMELHSKFSMAIANKSNGLFFYAKYLYDEKHINLFLVFAYNYMKLAFSHEKYLHPESIPFFQAVYNSQKNVISLFPEEFKENFPDLNSFDLGHDLALREYRQWCLNNTLYINPLNDLGNYSDASHDCLNLPTLVVSAKRPPAVINLYSQIKQEYATARYSFYFSMSGTKQHISDIDVPIMETIETVTYSYYVEQLKIAFRLSYSILDKIAFLLNDYLGLQIPANKVSFKSLWYEKNQLRDSIQNSKNWPLRGLFWLSKDLYEKDDQFTGVLEPEAREIATIRNYIEHKGFKIVPDFCFFNPAFDEEDISYSITRRDFNMKTLKLLKLTRAAIIYTALAVSCEEIKMDRSGAKAMPIAGTVIPSHNRV